MAKRDPFTACPRFRPVRLDEVGHWRIQNVNTKVLAICHCMSIQQVCDILHWKVDEVIATCAKRVKGGQGFVYRLSGDTKPIFVDTYFPNIQEV